MADLPKVYKMAEKLALVITRLSVIEGRLGIHSPI